MAEMNGRSNDSNGSRDFLIGAIVGGLAGAAAALFLTPKSGKELRGNINAQTTALKDAALAKGSNLATVAKEKAATVTQTVTQQTTDLMNKVKGGGKEQEPETQLQAVPTSMAETSDMPQTHTATGDEIQRKLEETQQAFDETERKMNQ